MPETSLPDHNLPDNSPHEFLNPKSWKPARGYSNGISASGKTLFLGGMIGWNGQQEFESDDFVERSPRRCATSLRCLPMGMPARSTW